jgi:hypothetical protein
MTTQKKSVLINDRGHEVPTAEVLDFGVPAARGGGKMRKRTGKIKKNRKQKSKSKKYRSRK